MYGSPRQHIWTFAAGREENSTRSTDNVCPCDTIYKSYHLLEKTISVSLAMSIQDIEIVH